MKEVTDPRIQRDEEKCGEVEEDDTAVEVPEAAAADVINPDLDDGSDKEGEDERGKDDDMGIMNITNTRDAGGRYAKWNDDVNRMKKSMQKSERGYWGDISALAEQEEMYWDDMTGEQLISSEVHRARTEEMEEFKKHHVYTKVPLKKSWDSTGKGPIGVRWVDINKGDKVNPEYRSRLVAKEIKLYRTLDLFAATPPLEAKTMLFSLAVTSGIGFKKGRHLEGMKVDFVDVRRAYFHADARRQVFVELPAEDMEDGMCGGKIHVWNTRCSTELGICISGIYDRTCRISERKKQSVHILA